MGATLKQEFPEVEDAVTIRSLAFMDDAKGILRFGDTRVRATELYVTGNFFNIFSFRLLEMPRLKTS